MPRWLLLLCLSFCATTAAAEFQINTFTTYGQKAPSIAATPDGGFVVVWSSYSLVGGYSSAIFGRRYDSNGVALGEQFQVSDSGTEVHRYPDVATGPDGSFVVVWDGFPGQSYSEIYGQRFDSQGDSLGTNFLVNSYTTQSQQQPEIGIDDNGDFVVVWAAFGGHDGDGAGVFGQRFDAAGGTIGTEFLVNATTAGYQTEPLIAISPGGEFVVVWEGNPGSGLFARQFDGDGAPLASEFQVASGFVGGALGPLDGGGFLVLWQGTTLGSDIVGQRYDGFGAPVGTEFEVIGGGGGALTAGLSGPRHSVNKFVVDTDTDGSFVVVWDALEIYGRHFDSDAMPTGGAFQVNSYTTSQQSFPTAAMTGGGDFVVAWSSFGQDGDAYGIFAERFLSAVVACPAAPQDPTSCLAPGRSQLQMKAQGGKRNKLKWKWGKGDDVAIGELGDPLSTTSYALCIYEDGTLIKSMQSTPGGTCAGKPCWKATGSMGFSYKDRDADPSGVHGGLAKLKLRAGDVGKARAQVQGKGPTVFPQSPLPLAPPAVVTAQLINGENACWTTEYDAGDVRKSDDVGYVAKD